MFCERMNFDLADPWPMLLLHDAQVILELLSCVRSNNLFSEIVNRT